MGAVVEAITALGAGRVALATPYSERANALVIAFLRAKGFDVVSSRGMGIHDTSRIGWVDDEQTIQIAKAAAHPAAEVLFLSCTNLPTLGLIPVLEADTGLPVVTSNQALMWSCLRHIAVWSGSAADFGRLMAVQVEQQPTPTPL